MISVVLGPGRDDDPPSADMIVRSLSWLVSAVVAGVIRDVVLAASAKAKLGDIADATGCRLVEAETAACRYGQAVQVTRSPRILVLEPGYTADNGLVDELESFDRSASAEACARILTVAAPWRFRPPRAVGVVASRTRCLNAASFGALLRDGRRGVRFVSRMRPVR